MKKMLLAAGIAASIALVGCSATQQANVNDTLANLNKTNLLALQAINNGCKIVQPTLVAAGAASPQVAAAAGVNAAVCATAGVAADAASAVVAAQAAVPASASAASAPAAASAPK